MAGRANLKLVRPRAGEEASNYREHAAELWRAGRNIMHSMHYVVSYQNGFKPEIADYCIKRFSEKGSIVFDPFCGHGTSVLQANILGRIAWGSDINPLAIRYAQAKTAPVGLDEVVMRLNEVNFLKPVTLSAYNGTFEHFYHPETYRELINLRNFLAQKNDWVNRFIELLTVSRLHGHNSAYFSSYSFPQVSLVPEQQKMLNLKRRQAPEPRALAPRIIKRAAQALRDGFSSDFFEIGEANKLKLSDSRDLGWIHSNSVDLVVTSPPALENVDYAIDHWLPVWFMGLPTKDVATSNLEFESFEEWQNFISDSLSEILRVLKPGAFAVLEGVESVFKGKRLQLDKVITELALSVTSSGKRFKVEEIVANKQQQVNKSQDISTNSRKDNKSSRLVVLKCLGSAR